VKKLKFITLGSYILCIILSAPLPIYADVSWSNISKGAVAAGAALIGIGGLVTLTDWALSETDEQLFEKADRLYRHAYVEYYPTTNWFEQSCHLHSINPQECNRVIRNLSEQLLNNVAKKIWYINESETTYRSNLRTTIKQLRSFQEKLSKRIYKIQSQYHVNAETNRYDMELLKRSIQNMLPHLVFFSDYLEHHRSYFSLYEYEGILYGKYQQEFKFLTNHAYDRYILAQELKYIITKKQNGSYPYINYAKQLNRHLNEIKNRKACLAYNYVARINPVQQIIDSLEYIQGIVVADPLYRQELYAQEQEKLKREHIAVMQKQARLEQNKVDLLAEQNHILKQQLALKEQELREKYGNQHPTLHAVIIQQ